MNKTTRKKKERVTLFDVIDPDLLYYPTFEPRKKTKAVVKGTGHNQNQVQ
jgi:hypothetical protein